jgi:hypothetical protein
MMSDWIEGTKPKHIESIYKSSIDFDLEKLGIDWDNIKDYYIKYGILHVDFKDGTSKEYEGEVQEVDYKRWCDELIYTEDWDLVEGLNE